MLQANIITVLYTISFKKHEDDTFLFLFVVVTEKSFEFQITNFLIPLKYKKKNEYNFQKHGL